MSGRSRTTVVDAGFCSCSGEAGSSKMNDDKGRGKLGDFSMVDG